MLAGTHDETMKNMAIFSSIIVPHFQGQLASMNFTAALRITSVAGIASETTQQPRSKGHT